ncbi:MAG: hypothetical protein KC912_01255 [Proteobacteria bacterium]|nr:hypothetical protein [Pseudomonadota bacterium]
MIRLLPLLILLPACKRPPEAPAELDDLSRYLYRSWGAEDEAEREVGFSNLIAFLETIDMEDNLQDRAWELTPVNEDDLWDIEWPTEQDPAATLGVAVARQSVYPPLDHATLQIEEDQLPAEPSANEYVRTFDVDPTCFLDETCNPLFSVNQVQRQNLLISVDFTLYKDFRWVETDNGPALFARSYVDQVWEGNSGGSSIVQSYSCDIWLPDGNGTTWRYQTLWSESEVGGASDSMTIATLKASIDNILETGDEAIEELFYPAR